MYPVVKGEPATRLAMVRYVALLVPVTMAGGLMPPLGGLYSAVALGLGVWWGYGTWQLLHAPHSTAEDQRPARKVFKQSLLYLALIFLAMVVDTWL